MTKGIVYGIDRILDIVVHQMRSSWNMWDQTWVSRSRYWLLTGEHLGHVCMSPEPVGSTHLRFDDDLYYELCDLMHQRLFGVPDETTDMTRSLKMVET